MRRTPLLSAGRLFSLVAAIVAVEAAEISEAAPDTSPAESRGFAVEEDLRNDRAAFRVRVSVDHKDRVYAEGEEMRVTVKSEEDGYLYLIYNQADGSSKCLFPNCYESDNRIEGKKPITIPTPRQEFTLTCRPPFGEESLKAIVSKEPLAVERLGVKSLTRHEVTDVDLSRLSRSLGGGTEVEESLPVVKPDQWAEHSVRITAVPKRNGIKSPARRLGLFIGISKYKDSRIPGLHLCHKDALSMAGVMKERCALETGMVLTDEEATRENIQNAFRKLSWISRPGDMVFIYWSGHGGRCEDAGKDEADGWDEVLVPHDGDLDRPEETMILDDAFGRWIQELDGRNIVVILDACYGGGQAVDECPEEPAVDNGRVSRRTGCDERDSRASHGSKGVDELDDTAFLKGLGSLGRPIGPRPATETGMEDDFFTGEMVGIKDIGQEDAAAIFSSSSDEVSRERRDDTLSVMTYFLRKKITESDSLTLEEAYVYLKAQVPPYVKETFKDRQTPQLWPEKGAAEIRLR